MGGRGASSESSRRKSGNTVKAEVIGDLNEFLTEEEVSKMDRFGSNESLKMYKEYANLPVIAKLPNGVQAEKVTFFVAENYDTFTVYRSGSQLFAVRESGAQRRKEAQWSTEYQKATRAKSYSQGAVERVGGNYNTKKAVAYRGLQKRFAKVATDGSVSEALNKQYKELKKARKSYAKALKKHNANLDVLKKLEKQKPW